MHNSLWQKRIVVTRPESQASALCQKLTALGAIPIRFPTIRLEAVQDKLPLVRVLGQLHAYDWVVFTSINGVAFVRDHLTGPLPSSLRVAAIGPATADALQQAGIHCNAVPSEYVAEQIVEVLGDVAGKAVLLLRADAARKALALQLQARGAHVEEVAVYRTLANRPGPAAFHAFRNGADVITFTSSSTVRFFAALPETRPSSLETALIACIGPITAMTARSLGYTVGVVANEYTAHGLVCALEHYFEVHTA